MVGAEGGAKREVENRKAEGCQTLGEYALVAMPQEVAHKERERSSDDTDDDASTLADPVAVDRVLEEESDKEDERDYADAIDPGESDLGFDFCAFHEWW